MNNQLQALTTASKRVNRMVATFEMYDRSHDLKNIGTREARFTELVESETHAAELGIQACMDEVGGENHTRLDTALAEVRQTRSSYTAGRASEAFDHAKAARTALMAVYTAVAAAA